MGDRQRRHRSALRGLLVTAAIALAPVATGAQTAALSNIAAEDVARDLALGRYERLVEADPAGGRAELAAALAVAGADPRLAFDLVSLLARAEAAAGDARAEAARLRDLAALALRHRDMLGRDPVPLLEDAAAASEAAGDLPTALALAEAIVGEARGQALPAEALREAHARVARLAERAGRADLAAAARQDIDALAGGAAALQGAPATRSAEEGFEVLEVFYATDRARTGRPDPARFYGAGRGALELGTLKVTIPRSHRAGALEAPSIWRLEFGPDPAEHVVLRSVTPVAQAEFYGRMQARIAETTRREAIVFVHGYNVTFEHAAKRAAQLAYDTGFPGVPVLYSWPSRGATSGYIADTAVVRLSGRRLARFLDDLVARSGAETVHLVAHSMGSRAMTDALEILALARTGRSEAPPFGQVVFAAPDLDAGLFAEMIPTIRPLARRITLYGSEADWALAVSRRLHGDAPRAGEGGADALALAEIDTVDMSALGEDMLAHSYVSNDRSALLDLVSLLWKNLAPDRRCGIEPARRAGAITVWRYVPGECRDTVLIGLLATLHHAGAAEAEEVAEVLARVFDGAPPPEDVARVVGRMAP